MEVIRTENAPAPVGPYSQAVKINGVLYISGQIPLTPSGVLINNDISLATKQVMDNIGAILDASGLEFSNVVKTSIFVTDLSLFNEVNAVYFNYFENQFPARETIQVAALPKGAMIEISAIAVESIDN